MNLQYYFLILIKNMSLGFYTLKNNKKDIYYCYNKADKQCIKTKKRILIAKFRHKKIKVLTNLLRFPVYSLAFYFSYLFFLFLI